MTYESNLPDEYDNDLEPRPWSEIKDDDFNHLDTWTEMGGAMRIYQGEVYVQIDDGWVELDEALVSFREAVEQFNESVRRLSKVVEEQTHPEE